ncbi:MAG TPA: IPT/TIG domain-containing protein [Thermoanaerobaculia bacterium]|nr:IPT/TIG domain-containing protein [Thermoanaerobaculia bacterium]
MPAAKLLKSTSWLGIAFLLIGISLAYLLVALWPRTQVVVETTSIQSAAGGAATASPGAGGGTATKEKKAAWAAEATVMGYRFRLDPDVRLLILVLLAGALGSYIHAVQSFASYVGNSSFKSSWTWWYILRMPMGAALALFIYFVVRGGLLAAGTAGPTGAANDLNIYGIMSFAGLAGLFSKQAADKLSEVFDTLFATKEDHKREDKLGENPKPQVASIDPDTLPTGAAAAEITVKGQGFVKDSVVKAAGKKLKTTFKSAQILTAQLATSDFSGRAEVGVSVVNPAPGGGESDPFPLALTGAGGGMATVTPISGGSSPS